LWWDVVRFELIVTPKMLYFLCTSLQLHRCIYCAKASNGLLFAAAAAACVLQQLLTLLQLPEQQEVRCTASLCILLLQM
jgi:hypothetical protein